MIEPVITRQTGDHVRRNILGLCILFVSLLGGISGAQDGLNLPTELYILRNEGIVDRYGLGAAGVQPVTPEDQIVLDFRVAPDGNWLAYRTQDALYAVQMYGNETTRLLDTETASLPPIRGRGETIAWSPDSTAIAYTTLTGARVQFIDGSSVELTQPDLQNIVWSPDGRYLAAGADQNIWWIFRRDDRQLNLTAAIPQAAGTAWLDGARLLFAPPEGGLTLMDLANANAQTPILDTFQTYRLPYVRSDGTILVFATDETAEPVTGRLLRVRLTDAGVTVEEAGAAEVEMSGLRWSPGGDLMVAFQGGVLALVNPVTGEGFNLPISSVSAYGWGPTYPPALEGIAAGESGYFIAPGPTGIDQVWHMSEDGTRPTAVTSAVLPVVDYYVALDESLLVYVSDERLWLQSLTGADSEPQELVLLGAAQDTAPSLDAGATTVYFRDEQAENGIYRLSLTEAGAVPELMIPDTPEVTYHRPQTGSGVNAVLVETLETSGDRGFVVYDPVANERLVFIRYANAASPDYGDPAWFAGSEVVFAGVYPRDNVPTLGFHTLDVNNIDAGITTLLPLIEELRLLDFVRQPDNSVRALVRLREPGQVVVLDVPIDGSTPQTVANAGYVFQPQLSPQRDTLIGLTHPGGSLVLFDIESGERTRLAGFPSVADFIWR